MNFKDLRSEQMDFVHINGALPLIENLFFKDASVLNYNEKAQEALNKISSEKGPENIILVTTNTGYLTFSIK